MSSQRKIISPHPAYPPTSAKTEDLIAPEKGWSHRDFP